MTFPTPGPSSTPGSASAGTEVALDERVDVDESVEFEKLETAGDDNTRLQRSDRTTRLLKPETRISSAIVKTVKSRF